MSKASSASKSGQIALFQQQEAPEPFKKAVQAIHVSPVGSAITLQQRRLFNSLIKNAIEQRLQTNEQASTFSIGIPQMMAGLGLTTKDTGYIKETAKSLMRTVVDWDQLNSDGTSTWTGSTLIAGAKITGSMLSYSFAPQICEELLNPERYAMIDMRIARLFRRAHTLALWENTVRYERVGQTGKMSLSTFRSLILGREEGETKYKEYKIFKRAVLIPCIAEINAISDHNIELIEHKVGRSVVDLQFKIERKKEDEIQEDIDVDLVANVGKFGIPVSEARKMVRTYGAERVRQAVDYTRARQSKKHSTPVENVAAYFRKSLVEDWGKGQEPISETAQSPVVAKRSAARTAGEARESFLAARLPEAEKYFAELSDQEQNDLIGRYNEQCESIKLKIVPAKQATKLVKTSFFTWVAARTWGEPTSEDILDFVLSGKIA
ncbi:RepB family plasmid replication initiator protein [Cupriavidus basilensis]|uniref:RepB family plasmid replication initiator protein n=2 Tax=Cupriavidus basilensis TaxID=68895 RepID=A0ABT6AL22_9BURK|nr:RepB family plasmid replication initiator protein [Cupriavidus basilensis]MDF3833281.1 RepB family plasmid replication initiator protein [Cupriavidus basilensis]